jgi:hypothetical protein
VAAFDRNHWQPFVGISGMVCAGLSNHYDSMLCANLGSKNYSLNASLMNPFENQLYSHSNGWNQFRDICEE